MPYPAYAGMSDDDMTAIIAYLRSLEPTESEIGEAVINDDMSREDVRTVPEIDPEAEFPAPEMADATEYGTYLATHVSACIRCHGGVDEDGVLDPEAPATADILLYMDFGSFNAPALVQDGAGQLTDEELRTRIHEGLNEDGQPLFLMPTYAFTHLADEEVDALIAWIRSQP
jgi:mono/diheme cytochrome c family protein